MAYDLDVRIDLRDRLSSGSQLGASDILGAMNHLALEIREVHNVKINDAQSADACRGEIKREGRAQSAGPDTEYLGSLQPELTLHADLRHDQVPAITQDLVIAQLC